MSQTDYQLGIIADALRAVAQQMQIQNQQLAQIASSLGDIEHQLRRMTR